MILSEFAGAAQSLNGSIVVNPWDSQEVADAIFEAVTMDVETRAENHRKLFKVSSRFIHLRPCAESDAVCQQILCGVLGNLLRAGDDQDSTRRRGA